MVLRSALSLLLVALGIAVGPARPTFADCVISGTTVICSGTSPGAFSTADSGLGTPTAASRRGWR